MLSLQVRKCPSNVFLVFSKIQYCKYEFRNAKVFVRIAVKIGNKSGNTGMAEEKIFIKA